MRRRVGFGLLLSVFLGFPGPAALVRAGQLGIGYGPAAFGHAALPHWSDLERTVAFSAEGGIGPSYPRKSHWPYGMVVIGIGWMSRSKEARICVPFWERCYEGTVRLRDGFLYAAPVLAVSIGPVEVGAGPLVSAHAIREEDASGYMMAVHERASVDEYRFGVGWLLMSTVRWGRTLGIGVSYRPVRLLRTYISDPLSHRVGLLRFQTWQFSVRLFFR